MVSIYVNSKKSNQNNEIQIVELPYIMPINDKMNTIDAYENLMFDTLLGDQTNFIHWTELVYFCLFIDEIEKVWSYKQPDSLIIRLKKMNLKKVMIYLKKMG